MMDHSDRLQSAYVACSAALLQICCSSNGCLVYTYSKGSHFAATLRAAQACTRGGPPHHREGRAGRFCGVLRRGARPLKDPQGGALLAHSRPYSTCTSTCTAVLVLNSAALAQWWAAPPWKGKKSGVCGHMYDSSESVPRCLTSEATEAALHPHELCTSHAR